MENDLLKALLETNPKAGRPKKNDGPSLTVRVSKLEKEIEKFNAYFLKKYGDLIIKPEKQREPQWIPWKPAHKGPNVEGRKVAVMFRNGEISDKEKALPVEELTWREVGPRTIIAYSVV